jgi:hypothetical protein
MKRATLLLSLLIVTLFVTPSNATTIDSGSHILSFGIVEGIGLQGAAELLVIDGGSTQGDIDVEDNAVLTMLGGHIEGALRALGAEMITIKGGTIGGNIYLDNQTPIPGDVYIYGTYFEIDGGEVGPGRYSEDGVFKVILENGGELDNHIFFSGSNKVVLVPEPATMILLAIGTLYIRKRKSTC